jgi:single-strand DNA-binding protein
MANVNKVILIGNVTRDPELSYLPSQTAVVNFGLAMNRKWKTTTGEAKEEVCFVDCQAFAKGAETLNKYVHKGDPLYIDGRLKFEQWEKEGQKHSRLRIIIESFQFLSTKPKTAEAAPEESEKNDIPF